MNDLLLKAKMINKRREALRQMSDEYKRLNDFHRAFLKMLAQAGNRSFMHQLFDHLSDEEYL